DMPVAVWWLGDLPNEEHDYVETLLDCADRLIVDSSQFDSVADLVWLDEIAKRTTTAPADLNWVRLEDWRLAAAMLFDPQEMRDRLRSIRRLSIAATGGGETLFGYSIESLYFAGWMNAQAGVDRIGDIEYAFDLEPQSEHAGALSRVRMEFDDHSEVLIARDSAKGVLQTQVDGVALPLNCVTRVLGRATPELIVRQLKRPEADRVFVKALPIAAQLAARLRA
ncbi:MAG TPA: OpcA/G6PD domain-containing protein, partial [Thermoanaerobaculia bacterium]